VSEFVVRAPTRQKHVKEWIPKATDSDDFRLWSSSPWYDIAIADSELLENREIALRQDKPQICIANAVNSSAPNRLEPVEMGQLVTAVYVASLFRHTDCDVSKLKICQSTPLNCHR
jgi:hypothetical protein